VARLRPILPLALIALVSGLIAAAPAGAQHPGVPWSDLLPPVASPDRPQPKPVAHCREPSIGCISTQARRLRAARERLGCDHRAVFATTYMVLTRHAKKWLLENPGEVSDHRYLFIEDALFANFYFRVLRAWDRDEPVPQAWRIAFESAESGDYFGAQDMLLGINAHVQNDMPFVLAALGLREPDGDSRKPDHDAINQVLARAYEPVVDAVKERYDSSLDLTNPSQAPLDDAAGLEAVRGWREIVWRNAERLVNAGTDAERAAVAAQIEQYAGLTASLISAPPALGYGATRDAYCHAQLGR
jgi:Family of unknown function (DUF5995)